MIQDVCEIVWDYYHTSGRDDLPWRQEPLSAYEVLVSEMMLQQTQVVRVIPKYQQFIDLFPTAQDLAQAALGDVLRAWTGLGYNRRAKYLHEAAKQLANTPQPWSVDDLVTCKGVGSNTAAAVCVYAYNQPLVFIETNIRTVCIHHFFNDREDVTDKEILPIISDLLDTDNPREWYWALMDYGSYLKKTIGNPNRSSRHYVKQPAFKGSKRQIRGHVIRLLTEQPMSDSDLALHIKDDRLPIVLANLLDEGLIIKQSGQYTI